MTVFQKVKTFQLSAKLKFIFPDVTIDSAFEIKFF